MSELANRISDDVNAEQGLIGKHLFMSWQDPVFGERSTRLKILSYSNGKYFARELTTKHEFLLDENALHAVSWTIIPAPSLFSIFRRN